MANPPTRFAGVKGNAVLLAQNFVAAVLHDGCLAVDATAGNGNDTLFLAGRVGTGGKVYAFDIQSAALDVTGTRLKEAGLQDRVVLIRAGHEAMALHLTEPVDAFLFNLGYLPGGDHALFTRPDTTVTALNTAVELLKPGGRIAVVVYTGHSGALDESRAVQNMTSSLNPQVFGVLKVQFANRAEHAPYLILIERAIAKDEDLAQQTDC
ncbi:MAG TPA: methyltransferase domain-containing protein [Desulfotomaculum sp.]|nr:MAG: methyltransferase [Peptococcaceae bacterium BRH_c8a]KJS78539.1 MAG: methyltransferase [Desulfotomaculum sp. BICA1-6]HBX24384.1 methyltransferase domain-containing protein [Desulfotomaculum sp.]